MAETAVPTVMEIVGDLGGSGDPKTIVQALNLLRSEIAEISTEHSLEPLSNDEIDEIIES